VVGTKRESLLAGKIKVVKHLKEKAQQYADFSWAALATRSLFEFVRNFVFFSK
jgi:predicted translin family RNA/ssDNA-binding protein